MSNEIFRIFRTKPFCLGLFYLQLFYLFITALLFLMSPSVNKCEFYVLHITYTNIGINMGLHILWLCIKILPTLKILPTKRKRMDALSIKLDFSSGYMFSCNTPGRRYYCQCNAHSFCSQHKSFLGFCTNHHMGGYRHNSPLK